MFDLTPLILIIAFMAGPVIFDLIIDSYYQRKEEYEKNVIQYYFDCLRAFIKELEEEDNG